MAHTAIETGVRTVTASDGREYRVTVEQDTDAESPRDWDNGGNVMHASTVTGSLRRAYVNELDQWESGDAVLRFMELYGMVETDRLHRAYGLWSTLTGSTHRLVTGTRHGYTQGDWWDYAVLVDVDGWQYNGTDRTAEDFADRIGNAEMDTHAAYAFGDVVVASVSSSDGEFVDSCAGFYDADSLDGFVTETIAADVARWAEAVATVGAGFVGPL